MKWNSKKNSIGLTLTIVTSLSFLSSCNSGGGSAAATDGLVVSGQVGVSRKSLRKLNHLHDKDINPADINLSDFTLSCVTLQAVPTSGSGVLDASGNFSFTIPSAAGAKITCNLLQNTLRSSDSVIASMIVVDSDEQDIDGNDKKQSSVGLTDDTDFGNLNLDIESGELSVDKSNIAGTIASELAEGDTYWDSTGAWTISKLDTIPEGYSDICTPGKGGECNGPSDGEQIYFKQITGKKWVWDDLAHTGGAATSDDRYGIMIWSSQAALESCSGGSGHATLGTTAEEIKDHAKLVSVDFSGATGIEFTPYDFETTITGTDTITEGYKSDAATAQWPINDCHNLSYQGENAWICRDNKANTTSIDDTFQISLSGGCVNDQGTESTLDDEPIRIDNWNDITWDNPMSPCTNAESTAHTNFVVNTCLGVYDRKGTRSVPHITCKNEYSFSDANHPAPASSEDLDPSIGTTPGGFNWANVATYVNQGDPCSTVALNAHPLEQTRCYASYYEQNTRDFEHDDTKCFRKIRANWSATTPEDFISTSDEPSTRHAASFYDLDSTGIGSLHHEEIDYRGVQVDNSWINCKMKRSFTINLAPKAKVEGEVTHAVGTFESENVLVDNDKEACVAYMKDREGAVKKSVQVGDTTYDLWVSRSKAMFNLTKEGTCRGKGCLAKN